MCKRGCQKKCCCEEQHIEKLSVCELDVKNATIDNLVVKKKELIKGDLTVLGNTTLGNTTISNLKVTNPINELDVKTLNADIINVDTIMADGAFIDHSNIGCLKTFDCERWVTPDYDRFKQGLLPKLNPVFGTGTYEYENLTHLALPEQGDAWSAIVRGFINFSTATDREKLEFFAGATNRLYRLVIDRAWSASEQEMKIGFLQGWNNYSGGTLFQPPIPTDQQQLAAQALNQIMAGFMTININNLTAEEATNYYNHITICKIFIEAWNLGEFNTNNMGAEYTFVQNKHMTSNYCWLFGNVPPLINYSFVVAAGLNADPGYLLTWARSLPILFTYFETVIDQTIQAGIDGLKLGVYPHILRVNPFDSKGESTLGFPTPFTQYGQVIDYEQYIKDAVANNAVVPADNSITNAQQDLDIVDLTFEENLSDDVLFGFNSIGGTNPQYLIDLVVNAGEMSATEGAAIMAFCKAKYPTVMAAVKRFLNAYFFDADSPMVRALRLTKFDDFGGEWGLKFVVDETNRINDYPLVKGNKKVGGDEVLVSVIDVNVVIYDTMMNILPITLEDVDLQRDSAYGNAIYKSAIEIILGLSEDSPIPRFVLQDPMSPYNPTTNPYVVEFITDPMISIVDKIHRSGVGMVDYFRDSIEYNLNIWSIQKYGVPYTTQFPGPDSFKDAVAALKFDDRFLADLEDPSVGGNYAFIQHYIPKTDNIGPLYDWSVLRSYYTADPKDTPQLKLITVGPNAGRVDGPILYDRDNNVLYDPLAPVGADGFIDISALYAASQVDVDLTNYWRVMGSTDIADGKSSRYHYFNFDFSQRAYKSYITGGVDPTPDPIMTDFFSPYIINTFNKRMGTKYLQNSTASASNYDPVTELITYINYLDVSDPRGQQQGGNRSIFVHEWLMGHAIQQPLIQMITSLGTQPWTANAFGNGAVAEGWAVFLETFFCGTYTTYLSEADKYYNYAINAGGSDPKAVVSQLLGASRVAARLKWDTGYHATTVDEGLISTAECFRGFREDTFDTYDLNSEVAQRIVVLPGQNLNYGLAYCTLVGLFQRLSNPYTNDPNDPGYATRGLGLALFNSLQANGNKAFKYFFDFILIDTVGAFLGSITPAYDKLIDKIVNGVAPFNNPNYDGYPIGAFPVDTVAYVVGSNPAVYETEQNPYIVGGNTFVFPNNAIPI